MEHAYIEPEVGRRGAKRAVRNSRLHTGTSYGFVKVRTDQADRSNIRIMPTAVGGGLVKT